MTRQLSLGEAARFYLPLIFMAELMMVSHTIVHANLARFPDPTIALAAFSIAFSIQTMLASFVGILTLVAISFVTDRKSVFQVVRFGWVTTAFTTAFMFSVALTPLGDMLYGGLLGAGPEVTAQAREASLWFSFVLPMVVIRQVSNGLIMLNRKTLLITLATAVRVAGLVAAMMVTPHFLRGAAAGSAALLFCIFSETLFVMAMARPFFLELAREEKTPVSYRDIWRFVWPVMVNQLSENGLAVTVNFFLGRLARADLALAAFGVVRGLVMLLASPLRPLTLTAQTLVRNREDLRVMMGFTVRTAAAFTAIIALLFNTPLRSVVLDGILGLNEELSAYVTPAMVVAFLIPFLWGFSATFRGLIAGARKTRSLVVSAAGRLTVVVAVGSLTLVFPQLNGAIIGVCAMMAAFGTEGLVLGERVFLRRGAQELFRRQGAEAGGR